MTDQHVDVKVQVTALTTHYKRLEAAFQYPPQLSPHEVQLPKIDQNYVSVQLYFQNKEHREYCVSMLLEKEDAKKLNLMVGDKLTLKLVKDNQ